MKRHTFEPGRLIAGAAALAVGVGYALDAAGTWDPPPFALLPALGVGLVLAALITAMTHALRRRRNRARRIEAATSTPSPEELAMAWHRRAHAAAYAPWVDGAERSPHGTGSTAEAVSTARPASTAQPKPAPQTVDTDPTTTDRPDTGPANSHSTDTGSTGTAPTRTDSTSPDLTTSRTDIRPDRYLDRDPAPDPDSGQGPDGG
ncbi:hypothetical protein H8N01_13590 [Streptomyces sp. AC536]|uniref:hypothetical protein n=1 Tax=Streptomyces buecherae TaxID=2763006 RepID=UPI00164D1F4F|nr:hypothetical protein [Streptomyces buecherae]MBC3983563.1 hypothetical protein [Streptomyces buecherae]QNJ41958.1 hypothetical protein H7H31_20900 [Streptomyces buecherae]